MMKEKEVQIVRIRKGVQSVWILLLRTDTAALAVELLSREKAPIRNGNEALPASISAAVAFSKRRKDTCVQFAARLIAAPMRTTRGFAATIAIAG
jgi:hypothetical protein